MLYCPTLYVHLFAVSPWVKTSNMEISVHESKVPALHTNTSDPCLGAKEFLRVMLTLRRRYRINRIESNAMSSYFDVSPHRDASNNS